MRLPYVIVRGVQVLLAIVVLGIAGNLHSDILKVQNDAKNAAKNLANFNFDSPSYTGSGSGSGSGSSSSSSSSSGYGYPYGTGSSTSNLDDLFKDLDSYSDTLNNIRRDSGIILPRAPKKGGGSKSSSLSGGSGSSSSKDDGPKPQVATGMMIAAAVFSFIFAGAIAGLSFIPKFNKFVFKAAIGLDALLIILWIVAVALTGDQITKGKLWDDSKRKGDYFKKVREMAAKWKACFALGLLMMLLFIGSAVLSFLLSKNKSESQSPDAEDGPPPQYGQEVKQENYAPAPEQQQTYPQQPYTPSPEQQQQYPQQAYTPTPEQQQQQMYPPPQPAYSPGPQQQQMYPPPQQPYSPGPEQQQQYQQYHQPQPQQGYPPQTYQ